MEDKLHFLDLGFIGSQEVEITLKGGMKAQNRKCMCQRASVLAIFIFVFHLIFITSLIMVGVGIYSWKILIIQIAFKATLEYLFVTPVLKFLGKRILLPWFILMQLLYSFYAILIGLLAQFTGFSWKNRRYT